MFPLELAPELGELGVLGMHLEGYGCPGRSAVEYGLAAMELEAGDSGIRTFVSVQGSLAMTAIHKWGSEDQKQEWLPRMAAGELIGCFALTEPTAGSDPCLDEDLRPPRRLRRRRRLDPGRRQALDRARLGGGRAGGVGHDRRRRPRLPRPRRHRRASPRRRSGRSSPCAPPSSAISRSTASGWARRPLLPAARGLRGPFTCLNEARYGIAWGAMGAARDSYEAALTYSQERLQFGKPLAGYQLTQEKLVNMLLEIQKGTLLALHLGRLKDAGKLRPEQISLGKLNNVREAIAIAREARTILGGNGITLDYSPLRHAANLESVRTYEGTDEVHTLILGQHITGLPAFR